MQDLQHVLADFGDGYVVAHLVESTPVTGQGAGGDETKYVVQAPDGSKHKLALREKADADRDGSGQTFKTR